MVFGSTGTTARSKLESGSRGLLLHGLFLGGRWEVFCIASPSRCTVTHCVQVCPSPSRLATYLGRVAQGWRQIWPSPCLELVRTAQLWAGAEPVPLLLILRSLQIPALDLALRRVKSPRGGFARGRSHVGWGHHRVLSPEATAAGTRPIPNRSRQGWSWAVLPSSPPWRGRGPRGLPEP